MVAFANWFVKHNFSYDLIQDVIAAGRSTVLPFCPTWLAHSAMPEVVQGQHFAGREECFETLVRPAFEAAFPDEPLIHLLSKRVELEALELDAGTPPHAIDRGPDVAVLIRLNYTGLPDDIICLAHETAHALQILLSRHENMPPVAREVCAFLGELIVIAHAKRAALELFPALCDVWHRENSLYLGTDIDALSVALDDPNSEYHYRQNYPVARLAAVEMFQRGHGDWMRALFAAGEAGTRHLPLEVMANRAGDLPNYLPPLPEADAGQPAIDAYRSLGALTHVDIDYLKGEPDKQIGDYYQDLLVHLQDRTAFLGLNDQRQPIGYATWSRADCADDIVLTRQAAPFGDHLTLQRAVQRHLDQQSTTSARHYRSARQQQVAW